MCRNPYGIVMPYGFPYPSSWVRAAIVPTSSCAVMVRSVCGAACSRQSCGNRPGALVWPGHKVRHKVLLRFWGVGGLEGVFGVWVGVAAETGQALLFGPGTRSGTRSFCNFGASVRSRAFLVSGSVCSHV